MKKSETKKRILYGVLLVFLIVLFLRAVLPRQIDDVHPLMGCEKEELERADVFYVVPMFDDFAINESREWCDYILSMNRTVHMHGIRHTYKEFSRDIDKEDFEYAIAVFEDCFGFKPRNFKAPQLSISSENKRLLRKFDLRLDSYFNQIFHKVYHCNDTGFFPNSFHDFL